MSNRTKIIGGVGVVGLVVVAIAVYFLFFRDSAPVSVDSVEAAEARQEAIAEATGGGDEPEDTGAANEAGTAPDTGDAADPAADEGETELDSGQPDSNASVGSATDGVWTVDTSIGTFDDSCLTDVCGSTFCRFPYQRRARQLRRQDRRWTHA